MSPWTLWLCIVLLIGSCEAADVPFVFDETTADVAGYSSVQLEQAHVSSSDLAGVPAVTQVADNEVLDFPITGGGNLPTGTTEKKVSELKTEFDARVEPENPRVNDEALVLALKYPGDLTIDQIAAIYGYLKNGDESKKGWGYVRDPRGIDYLRYANATLKAGDKANCIGGGDCDDFAILMAALVESVGGTTRIILARNESMGGHAYTEVYLGSMSEQDNQVEGIIAWLQQKYDTDRIYTHIDTDTKDVWLNLDWGPDEVGNTHPGGPIYQGDKHIVLCIRDKYVKTPLKLPEIPDIKVWLPEKNHESFNGRENNPSLSIKYYSGIVTYNTNRWPFLLTLIGPTTNGSINGQIEWTTLNSINKIEGFETANSITFSETAYIKKGDAILNCKYHLYPDGSSFKGIWDGCGNGAHGDITMNPL
ncbi:MAG: transglutaminase-like domain-containing protein [Methanothrix sp.]|nr:transglutaminase-like domain-containing protein [Methanothrix sp.]